MIVEKLISVVFILDFNMQSSWSRFFPEFVHIGFALGLYSLLKISVVVATKMLTGKHKLFFLLKDQEA